MGFRHWTLFPCVICLQFQLRDLLGRENYKMYAAAIVDLAKQSSWGVTVTVPVAVEEL